jgi:hypothetical protein
MATAEHREPYESRGSRTVLGAPGGEIPPGDSTKCERLTASTCRPVLSQLQTLFREIGTSHVGHKQTKCVAVKSRLFNPLVGDREKFEPSYKAAGRSGVLGRPVVADFNPFGQKLQQDADPDRREPTLPKIDDRKAAKDARP